MTQAETVTSATPPSSAVPSAPAIAPSATAADAAREVGGVVGVLPPGRYTCRGFEPRLTFEVDGPWRSVQTLRDFFDIQQQVGSPDVIAVQFAKPDGIYGGSDAPGAATTAEAAIATIRLNDDIVVIESSASQIGGFRGLQITVENPAGATGDKPVVHVPAGPLGISPARRLWLAFFDTPEGLLAVMVGGSAANWDETLATAEPVLESITIGE